MRVALLAESFLPHMNGVTNSVLQVLSDLERKGHDALVIAPGSGNAQVEGSRARTEHVRSVPLPAYPQVRVSVVGTPHIANLLADFSPDVVHLASPLVLGWHGQAAAKLLGVPSVAVYQTDVIAYAAKYGVPGGAPLVAAHIRRLHRRSTLTLAPSTSAAEQLKQIGVDRVRLWGRGVDIERFTPERRDEEWRGRIASGEILVGYVGRLAAEKQVEDLRVLSDLPGVRLVIIGEGPARGRLEQELPSAIFTGFLGGTELARALASLDVFVHPGESETFCQGIQEAHASGLPVVATGRGGPVDLVRNSVNGWLYEPGDLGGLRSAVADLVGDQHKARAFGVAARRGVEGRSWSVLGDQLMEHYRDAIALHQIDAGRATVRGERPNLAPPATLSRPVRRYVAVGDSITEGLSDGSRMADGEYRGWADRLAELIAHAQRYPAGLRYANLAVRSRRIEHVVRDQIPRAIELRADLVSVLIGGNDLVKLGADPLALAARLNDGIRMVKASGAEVLLVTAFLPRRRASRLLAGRFAQFNSALRTIARDTGAILLDLDTVPALGDLSLWADDVVHLNSRGHRLLAYEAAARLGVPEAKSLLQLEELLHADESDPVPPRHPRSVWIRDYALPWVFRRIRGRTAGDGLEPKHAELITIRGASASRIAR
ncbi:GDSL-type esterase/lipase family protein [Microbacterium lacus]|uniref:GDSL-type esterase/lipase family protein n=1 Tax=Microbacterium lacus TaxID=415217 RepID=UPI00384E2284